MLIKKSKNLTILQKCEVLIEYSRKNGNIRKPIKTMTVDKQGRPVGRYQKELRNAYNKGNLNLPPEKIKELKQLKVLFRPQKEYEEMSQKYGIPANKIKHIERDNGSIENVVIRYKHAKFASSYLMDYYGVKDFSAIILSKRDLTVQDKSGFVRFAMDAFESLRGNLSGTFINKDYIDEVLSRLSDQERYIVEMIYGINGKENVSKIKLSKKIGISITDINKVLKKARILLLSKNTVVFRLEELTAELDRLKKQAEIAKAEGNTKLYNQIIHKIEQIQKLIQECNKAYERFIEYENIFRDDEIIPASGRAHIDFYLGDNDLKSEEIGPNIGQDIDSISTTLGEKKDKKSEQMRKIEQLQSQIDEQCVKESHISRILHHDTRELDK